MVIRDTCHDKYSKFHHNSLDSTPIPSVYFSVIEYLSENQWNLTSWCFKGGVCSFKTACQIWRYPHLNSPSHAPHFSARARFSCAAVWQVTSRQKEFVFCAGDGFANRTDHIRHVFVFLDNTCYSSPNAFDTRFPLLPFRYFRPPSEFRASLDSRDLHQLRSRLGKYESVSW